MEIYIFLLFMVNYIYISLFFFYCYGSDGYFYYMYCVDRRIYCDGKQEVRVLIFSSFCFISFFLFMIMNSFRFDVFFILSKKKK